MIKSKLKKGLEHSSKYPEDVFRGNHASVWGSWWNEELGWGYKCCHIVDRQNHYCLGDRGKKIALLKEVIYFITVQNKEGEGGI